MTTPPPPKLKNFPTSTNMVNNRHPDHEAIIDVAMRWCVSPNDAESFLDEVGYFETHDADAVKA